MLDPVTKYLFGILVSLFVLYAFALCSACAPLPPDPTEGNYEYTTAHGVEVYTMDGAYPPPETERLEQMADTFRQVFVPKGDTRLLFNKLTLIFFPTIDDVQKRCGDNAAACYWPTNQIAAIPLTHCAPALGHEWLHHAFTRQSATMWSDGDHEVHMLWKHADGPVETIKQGVSCVDVPGGLVVQQPDIELEGDVIWGTGTE